MRSFVAIAALAISGAVAGPCKPRPSKTSASVVSETSSAAIEATTLPAPPADSIITNTCEGGGLTSLDPFTTDGDVTLNTQDGYNPDGGSGDRSCAQLSAQASPGGRKRQTLGDIAALKQLLSGLNVRTQYTVQFFYYVFTPPSATTSCVLEASIGSQKFFTTGIFANGASISYNQVLVSTTAPASQGILNIQTTCSAGGSAVVLVDSIFISNQVTPENINDFRLDFGGGDIREPVHSAATTEVAPTTQRGPATATFPATQTGPATQNAPATETFPATENGPATETLPGTQTGPATQNGPATETFPGTQAGPATETFPGTQPGPATETFPSTQNGPATETFPGTQGGPSTATDIPTQGSANTNTAQTDGAGSQPTTGTPTFNPGFQTTTSVNDDATTGGNFATTTTRPDTEITTPTPGGFPTVTAFDPDTTIGPINNAEPPQNECVGTNLIDNGDFEAGTSGWSTSGNAGITYNGQFGPNARANSGNLAMALRWPSNNGVKAGFKRTITGLTPGMTYYLGYGHHTGNGAHLPFYECDILVKFDGVNFDDFDPFYDPNAWWQYRNRMNYVTPSQSTVELSFVLSCKSNPAPFTLLMDDVFLSACQT
ncbi:translation initiation factor IF-2 [Fusarium beomiforme]|uniref:Translation initiation factor IF-2 n=1 Tax=Fusarium beomiforme TaxID=44412 RepID=A0A9P5ARD7_9HYPO|nr:translation initiation factor IF-2 [Fusarium beomiforme]